MSGAPIVILGAGPTGIGAGLRLLREGREVVILEARGEAGGLSRSVTDAAGFTWDLGGHVFFSRNRPFTEALAPLPMAAHRRRASILLSGRRIPYPIQSSLGHLPPRIALSTARAQLLSRGQAGREEGFEAWCRGTFGSPLTDAFFLPYNRKAWGVDPGLLDTHWIAPAVRVPRAADLLRSLLRLPAAGWGMNASFTYPADGGCGSVWSRLALPLAGNLRPGRRAVAVDTVRKVVVAGDGSEWPYASLISSLPLPELVGLLRPGRPDLAPAAASLRANGIRVTGLGIAGPPPAEPWSWVYLPGASAPFYRISLLSSYSPALVPDPSASWSLLAETTLAAGRGPSPEEVAEAARRLGFLPGGARIVSTFEEDLPVAYPIPLAGRFEAIGGLLSALAGMGILSRGRYGAWLYELSSMDTSFLMGWEAAAALAGAVPETLLPGALPGGGPLFAGQPGSPNDKVGGP